MPLDETYRRSTVFILGKIGRRWRPIGTGFFVVVSNELNPNQHHAYVVTAAHVVMDEDLTAVRFRTTDGRVADKKVPRWVPHTSEDVAVTDIWFDPLDDESSVNFNAFLMKDALDVSGVVPRLGTPVYFLGLLDGVAEMGQAMIPMVRSGTLAAFHQPGIPLLDRKKTTAHLIDCRSFYGFSGSPCVVQEQYLAENAEGRVSLREHTMLMGVLTAHYDDTQRQRGEPTMKIHIGVGVVQPIERVRQVINYEEFLDMRRDEAEPPDEDREAVPDAALSENEFDNFERLTGRLLAVPKKELDEQRNRKDS